MRRIVFTLACVIGLLSMSACQPSMSRKDASTASDWACRIEKSPFTYSVCQVSGQALLTQKYALQLFWQQPKSKQPVLTFDQVVQNLPKSQTLAFAMNAGMYNKRFAPIGYTVIEGQEKRSLNLKTGGGNFHLLPNGVLWWDKDGRVQITESHAFDQQSHDGNIQPWYATQSGPMLVIDGHIHPQFNPDSTSFKFRNGAGVCSDGSIQFVNSDEPVTFYQFAQLFKDHLKCPNALFLDGGIASSFYAPSIERHDKKNMGVIIGMVEHKK